MRYSHLILLVFVLFSFGCKNKEYTLADFQTLNGYWQITAVIYPDGTEKKYKQPPAIDYIELNGDQGYKKKVYPKLDGTFQTSDDAIQLRVVKKNGAGYFLSYQNASNSWQEGINYLGEDYYSVATADGNVYCYDRFSMEKYLSP